MAEMMSSSCLKLISKIDERDQDAILARLDELQAQGVPAKRAQVQAAIDVLTGLQQSAGIEVVPSDIKRSSVRVAGRHIRELIAQAGEDAFRYGRSDAKDISQIADDVGADNFTVTRNDSVDRRADKVWVLSVDVDGVKRDAYISQKNNAIWVNVANLESGSRGDAVYQVAGAFARNNGLKFIGDPDGITESGKRRRLEAISSLALKYGNTSFIEPHRDMLGWNGFMWVGNEDDKLGTIAKTSYNLTKRLMPEAKDVAFERGEFTYKGERVSPLALDRLVQQWRSELEPSVREGAPGSGTVRMAALYASSVQAQDRGEGAGLRLGDGEAGSEAVRSSLSGIRASRQRPVFTDDVLAAARSDSKRMSGLVSNAIETDAQGVIPGRPRMFDRMLDRGAFTEDEVREEFKATLELIRANHGDKLTLWRSDAPDERKITEAKTVYMADQDVAEKYAANGRKAKPYSVRTDDLLAVYARPSGYYEAIVKIPEGGLQEAADITRSPRRNELGFYSALAANIDGINIKQAPAGAWKTALKGLVNKGAIKQDELFWTGLEDWLDLQQGKISKQQVSEYLDANGVKVEEVVLGENGYDAYGQLSIQEGSYGDSWMVVDEEGRVIGDEHDTREEAQAALDSLSRAAPSKYKTYTLPGGENYREVLLTLPTKRELPSGYRVIANPSSSRTAKKFIVVDEAGERYGSGDTEQEALDRYFQHHAKNEYKSAHWDQPNVLAHIRVDDRIDADGKRVLFVEEVQSDWGQEGKKRGFKQGDVFSGGQLTYDPDERDRLQPAPFVTKTEGWLNLALKRIMAMAVDGGYDRVAFVNGEQSADRYDLSRQVDSISYEPTAKGYYINVMADGRNIKNGDFTADELEDIVGKELVQKMEAREGKAEVEPGSPDYEDLKDVRVLRGDGLKVGGEGMKTFYDRIVPNATNALLKKVSGEKLGIIDIPDAFNGRDIIAAQIPGEAGWGLYDRQYGQWLNEDELRVSDPEEAMQYGERAARQMAAAIMRDSSTSLRQPGFDVTPKLIESATQGFALFSRRRNPQEDTAEFKEWSGDAPVVHLGEKHEFRSGQPVVVEALHGTTNSDLTEFKRERANIESDFGAGFYASNTPEDVAANYANNEGPDLTRRIERLAEQIADDEEFDGDMDDAMALARQRISEDSPNTLKLYVAFKNPAVLGGNGETFFDYRENYNEEAEEYEEPSGLLVDFVNALDEAGSGLDVSMRDLDSTKEKLFDAAAEGDGIKLRELARIVKDGMADTYSEDGVSAGNSEILRQALEGAGFDGVIDTTVVDKFGPRMIRGAYSMVKTDGMPGMTKDTVHLIAFNPTQLKSATGNNGQFDPANPDIRKSTGRTSTGAAWDSPSAEKFDDLVYKLQDKQIDTKRVVEAIKEASGAIADDLNVYLREELFHGRAAKRTEDFANMELTPLIEQLQRDGLKLEELEEYLHARHAPEANRIIAQRNPGQPGLQDGGSGMMTQDALNYMASLPADLSQKLDAAAQRVDDIIKNTRQMYVDYELESQDTINAWDNMFQHYIPLQREDKDGAPGLGQGFSIKGKEAKGRTGSTRKVVDIMANIALQRERAIVRGEKNRVSQALHGLAATNPNPEFWEVDVVPTERVFNPNTGLVEDRVDPLYKSRENAVIAKIKDANGKVREHAVLFNEEDERAMRMAAALKNLDAAQLEGLLGVSAKISRYFASINTSLNPVFGIVNLARDVQAAILNLSSTPLANDRAKIARYTLSAIRGIYADMRAARKGQNPGSQWAILWDDFTSTGGQTGYREMFATSADRSKAIQKALDPDAWMNSRLGKIFTINGALKVPVAQARRAAKWLFDWLSDYNETFENGVRLAAYKAGLERGLSKDQAASIAKNISVNFNRKGQVALQAGALYAFFNASIQGTARIGQTLFDMDAGKPKTLRLSAFGKKVVYGGMLLGSMQAMLLAAAGFNDDDPPEFARERSLILPIGGGKYITVPMPLGFHVIPAIGRMTTEFALSGFKDPHKRAVALASMFADTFNPIGNAGLSMQTLAPTALDPLVALTENKDYTGKPIARESSNKAIPGHALGRDTATSVAKFLSEAVNTLSGGNEYRAGVFSPTPDQIDYLIGQATGGVGRELSKVEQSTLAVARGEALPTYKVPLVGRFVGDAKSQASEGTAFYANTERLNELETEIKGLQKDGKFAEAAELRRSRSDSYLITMANQAERQIQRLRQQKRELIKAGADREQVKAIEDRVTDAMARLNRAAESLREKQ